MTKEKMTAPVASVGADGEQPLNNKITNQSIADLPVKGNLQATNNAENVAKSANKKNPDELETVSMMELYDTAYPPKLPIVDGLLYNGTYLFVGSPKIGKSFFMAQIGYHISKGLPLWGFPVRQGTVLYLALEDDYARLQKRLSQMFDVALISGVSEPHILEVKRKQISEPIKGAISQIGRKPRLFAGFVTVAIAALELMIESVLMKKYKEVSVQKEEINQTDEDIMLEKTATQVSDTENTQADAHESMPKAPEQEKPETKQSEMTRMASKYPRFFKVYNELEQQNTVIYKKEQQRTAKKKELSEVKGWFKGRKKKELQKEITELTSQIRDMKDYLPKIVQRVGYRNVQEFLKDFRIAKSEYSQYQKAIAQWKQENGKEPEQQPHGVRAKLAANRKKIEQEQKNTQRTRSQSKDRGAR